MPSRPSGKPTSLAEADHRAGIGPFVEGLQVLGLFADTDEADGHVELPDDGDQRPAAGGAIQFCDD